MAIQKTVMVSASSPSEFVLLVTTKVGITTIYHLHKNIESLNPAVYSFIVAEPNTINNRHYFVKAKEGVSDSVDISIAEINPHTRDEGLKFKSADFLQAFVDLNNMFLFQPGALYREVSGKKLPFPISFSSFYNLIKEAYPLEFQQWSLVDPGMYRTRQHLSVITE